MTYPSELDPPRHASPDQIPPPAAHPQAHVNPGYPPQQPYPPAYGYPGQPYSHQQPGYYPPPPGQMVSRSAISGTAHAVHAVLTFCTMGFWSPVWFLHWLLSRHKTVSHYR